MKITPRNDIPNFLHSSFVSFIPFSFIVDKLYEYLLFIIIALNYPKARFNCNVKDLHFCSHFLFIRNFCKRVQKEKIKERIKIHKREKTQIFSLSVGFQFITIAFLTFCFIISYYFFFFCKVEEFYVNQVNHTFQYTSTTTRINFLSMCKTCIVKIRVSHRRKLTSRTINDILNTVTHQDYVNRIQKPLKERKF